MVSRDSRACEILQVNTISIWLLQVVSILGGLRVLLMVDKTKYRASIMALLVMSVGSVQASYLKNPLERDENISGLSIEVEVSHNDDGFYEYAYTVINPESSSGRLGMLFINLRCGLDLDPGDLPPQDDGERWNFGIGGTEEERASRTPAIVRSDKGNYGITVSGWARWGLWIGPGEEWDGLKIISPVQPGMREFRMDPRFSTDPRIWDYESLYPEEVEQAPKPGDFRVTGMIEAPACPGVTPPPGRGG
jgi:hypothetical protein